MPLPLTPYCENVNPQTVTTAPPPPPPPRKLSPLSSSSFRNPSNVGNGQLCWPFFFFLTSPLRPHPSTAPLLLLPLLTPPSGPSRLTPSIPSATPPPSTLLSHPLSDPISSTPPTPSPPSASTPPPPPPFYTPTNFFSVSPSPGHVKTLHDSCRSLLNANCTNKNKTRKDRETSWFNCSTESETVKLNQSKYSVYFRFCFVFLSSPPPLHPEVRESCPLI